MLVGCIGNRPSIPWILWIVLSAHAWAGATERPQLPASKSCSAALSNTLAESYFQKTYYSPEFVEQYERNREVLFHHRNTLVTLTDSDIEFLRSNPRHLEKATDMDRVQKKNLAIPHSLDKVTVSEARLLDKIEDSGLLMSPVTRSVRKGADIKAGYGILERQYSLKGIYNDHPGQLEQSWNKARSEVMKLAGQGAYSPQETTGFVVDLSPLHNPTLRAKIRQDLTQVSAEQNKLRSIAKLPPLEIYFVE